MEIYKMENQGGITEMISNVTFSNEFVIIALDS